MPAGRNARQVREIAVRMRRGTSVAVGLWRHERREVHVLLSRCAWHPRYFGYPLVEGVVSWSGWGLRFTDGICPECATRFRAEYRAFIEWRDAGRELETRRRVA